MVINKNGTLYLSGTDWTLQRSAEKERRASRQLIDRLIDSSGHYEYFLIEFKVSGMFLGTTTWRKQAKFSLEN